MHGSHFTDTPYISSVAFLHFGAGCLGVNLDVRFREKELFIQYWNVLLAQWMLSAREDILNSYLTVILSWSLLVSDFIYILKALAQNNLLLSNNIYTERRSNNFSSSDVAGSKKWRIYTNRGEYEHNHCCPLSIAFPINYCSTSRNAFLCDTSILLWIRIPATTIYVGRITCKL